MIFFSMGVGGERVELAGGKMNVLSCLRWLSHVLLLRTWPQSAWCVDYFLATFCPVLAGFTASSDNLSPQGIWKTFPLFFFLPPPLCIIVTPALLLYNAISHEIFTILSLSRSQQHSTMLSDFESLVSCYQIIWMTSRCFMGQKTIWISPPVRLFWLQFNGSYWLVLCADFWWYFKRVVCLCSC